MAEDKKLTVFDVIGGIHTKKLSVDDERVMEAYTPWVVNTFFSLAPSTIFYANAMNMRRMNNRMQFDFYNGVIPKQVKPFRKWPKKQSMEDVNLVSRAFNYSSTKSNAALKVLTEDDKKQLNEIYGKVV